MHIPPQKKKLQPKGSHVHNIESSDSYMSAVFFLNRTIIGLLKVKRFHLDTFVLLIDEVPVPN